MGPGSFMFVPFGSLLVGSAECLLVLWLASVITVISECDARHITGLKREGLGGERRVGKWLKDNSASSQIGLLESRRICRPTARCSKRQRKSCLRRRGRQGIYLCRGTLIELMTQCAWMETPATGITQLLQQSGALGANFQL